jgi:hypothetical protein
MTSPPKDLRATVWAKFASTALAQALSEGPAQIDAEAIRGLDAKGREAATIRIIQQHQLGNVLFATAYADAMINEWQKRYEAESEKEDLICPECGCRRKELKRNANVLKCRQCWDKDV